MKTVLAIMLLSAVVASRGAAEPQQNPSQEQPSQGTGKVLDLGDGKVLDLVFRVEDMGGKVQSLEVKESATEVRIELAADVLFDFDKADILPKAQATLKQAADIIREKAKGTVRLDGHTDAVGSEAHNQKLSERRAAAVKSWFIQKEGLGNVSFVTEGFGARKPVAPNKKPDGSDDPDGRQKNRRVEIIIKKG
jgi:outer membrane protein OmpA-like peptidoglycan-associated protein